MTRRYGGHAPGAPETAEEDEQAGRVRQALGAGRVVVAADSDGRWALRWMERSEAPRCAVVSERIGPLDEAYQLALHLREEAVASYVSVTLSDEMSPVSSTTSGSDAPPQAYEVALLCRNAEMLTRWAVERLGVVAWTEIDARTRVETERLSG